MNTRIFLITVSNLNFADFIEMNYKCKFACRDDDL